LEGIGTRIIQKTTIDYEQEPVRGKLKLVLNKSIFFV